MEKTELDLLKEILEKLHIDEKKNSFETGKAGSRMKIYFKDATDLREQLESLQEFMIADA